MVFHIFENFTGNIYLGQCNGWFLWPIISCNKSCPAISPNNTENYSPMHLVNNLLPILSLTEGIKNIQKFDQ